MANMNAFVDTFLDYIPDPPMGKTTYRVALGRSFEKDEAEVRPIYALLKVTNRCASRCVYCAHAGVTERKDEASTEKLKDVLDQLAEVGAVSVNFTGGEPLQRKDLPELVQHARSCGLFPILLTNGLRLRRRIDELKECGLGMVIISVDSVRPGAYHATRGVPLERVLDGLDALREFPDALRPAITVTVVVTAYNVDHLDEIVSFFGRRGVGVKFCPYHHHGRWEDDTTSPQDPEAYRAAVKRLKAMKDAGLGVVNSHAYLDNFVSFTFRQRSLPDGYRCYCGYTTLYIDPALKVRSCWSQGLPVAGSLYKDKLRDLLQSSRMKVMRARIRKLDCERCWLLCTGEISLQWQ